MTIPIPKVSSHAWESHRDKLPQNAGLVFERFVLDWDGDGTKKKTALKDVKDAAARGDRQLLKAWNARWEAGARAMQAEPFTLRTDWRLIAGLGRKGPLEVGFTFHRYGFPILPGSSVKGLARAYAALVEEKSENDPDFQAIFGKAPPKGSSQDEGQSGSAIFLDAIPDGLPTLDLDIMNQHYPNYYSKGQAPTDSQNPNPVYFLTVAPSSPFRFAVGWHGPMDDTARRRRNLAQQWLIGGLSTLGAGSKTSAGYGYFQPPKVEGRQEAESEKVVAHSAAPLPVPPTTPTVIPDRPPKDVTWRKGKVSKGQVEALDKPGEKYLFSPKNVLPIGYTPAQKAIVEFIEQKLPDGSSIVWVKKEYFVIPKDT